MSAHAETPLRNGELHDAADVACSRVAPTWPLDRFIAVNPYWGYVHTPIERALAELGAVAGTRGLMSRAFYREAWQKGDVQRQHLLDVLAEEGSRDTPEQLIEALDRPDTRPERLPLLSDCVDARRDLSHTMSWRDVITHQISQFCAARFDTDQAQWHPGPEPGLYASWRSGMLDDQSVSLLTGERRLAERALRLPSDRDAMLAHGVAHLGVPTPALADYLTALLASVNGWAAWCAYLRWEARLLAKDDTHIGDLLAVRLAWECLIDDGERGPRSVHAAWRRSWELAPERIASWQEQGRLDWLWQRALEAAYERPLSVALTQSGGTTDVDVPSVQAVFCIDVRSEVMRRALETVAPSVQTLGFAGFFGLPIAYTPIGTTATRPQLPGLIAPTLPVTDVSDNGLVQDSVARARAEYHEGRERWHHFESMPASIFTFVESCGLFYLPTLLRKSLTSRGAATSLDQVGLPPFSTSTLRPRLSLAGAHDTAELVALAERVLRGMSLTRGFARLVLMVGHGSQSANNAHAAGLDCGACGGQTGEVNARVLAPLLNESAVREGLRERCITVPSDTYFLAALHNTTTDEVRLCDADLLPASHVGDVDALRVALEKAGHRARAERAPRLGIGASDTPERLLGRYRARANDWAQVRPEWGLAGNASLIVAPRARTRCVPLAGRTFLHDYDCRADADGSVLAQIMTAPMVVANWINMQYFASVVDNGHFGSGNKLLHNVVGGRIGVFEGNGGDLRIGLPLQSVHDGQSWAHTPLRLHVYIEAPSAAIDTVIAQHSLVRHLVENRWMHLFRLHPERPGVETWIRGCWRTVDVTEMA